MIIKKHIKQTSENISSAEEISAEIQVEEEKIDLFDLDNIDYAQRQERRRGDRRRGYRRIDDRNLISRAQEEAGTIRESAAKEGYKAGIEQAQDDIAGLRNAVTEFLRAKQEVFEFIAPDILEISIEIARKIVKKEIEQDPQVVLESILDVLKTISKDESKINIRVNPSQLGLVKESIPSMVNTTGIEARISVTSDENIAPGSCMLYTSNGVVDATIETQLEIIKEALRGI